MVKTELSLQDVYLYNYKLIKYKMSFIFFIYILILFFYTWHNLVFNKNFNYFDVRNLYLDNIKTGDIFLLANTKPNKILGDLILNMKFYHPSIVFWEDSNLFILEFGVYPTKQGLLKIPFMEWLNFNKNKLILHNPLKIKEKEEKTRLKLSKDMLSFYEKNRDELNKLDKSLNLNNLRILFRLDSEIKFNNILCTEVITKILYNLKIAESHKNISYYKVSDFVGLKGFKIKKNFHYNENFLCNFQHLIKKYI
jgi:hypothetical protein